MTLQPVTSPTADESQTRHESRRLRTAGFVLIAASLGPLGVLDARQAWNGSILSAEPAELVLIAALYLGGANVLALGFVVLLAGLRGVPLLSQPRARRGALVKMAGANAMMIVVAFSILNDDKQLGDAWTESWVAVPVLGLVLLVSRAGMLVLRRGWKYDAVSAQEALKADPRSPVVYLRSFEDDRRMVITTSRFSRLYEAVLRSMTVMSLEQELAAIMSRAGPVVGIGRPGESLPELGAARVYVDDTAWRETITELMRRARLVVVRVGATENLWWEIERAVSVLPPQRVVMVSLGTVDQRRPLEARIAQRFGPPTPIRRHRGRLRTIVQQVLTTKNNVSQGAVIYFDDNGSPFEETIELRLSWGFFLAPYRPYKDSLEHVFRQVFPHLGIPWERQRSQFTATLLAMLGGSVGAHLFYLGNRRKAVYYAAFFWTAVPGLLGWRDAIRLAAMDKDAFHAAYGARSQQQPEASARDACATTR